MLCFYCSLLILYLVFYLYFVFLLLPTWRIKPDNSVRCAWLDAEAK